jgi:hypothetical protein
MEISQAGSSQHKQPLRVTNVIGHGPGIKLLNGLARNKHQWGCDLCLPLPYPLSTIDHGPRRGIGKFLLVIGPIRSGKKTP